MNTDPGSLCRYVALSESAGLADQVRIGVSREGDGFILAGAHSDDGFCWCQPIVIMVPCTKGMQSGDHMDHQQFNHRRNMDTDVLEDDSEFGFRVDRFGSSWPLGQDVVGPQDRERFS